MSDWFTPSRRAFLGLAGVAGAAAAVPTAQADVSLFEGERRRAVLVHDPDLAVPESFAQRLLADGGLIVPLAGDPVRLWRDGLAAQVGEAGALYGLTLWADLLIFQGLARELRRNLKVSRQDASTGRFAWMIA